MHGTFRGRIEDRHGSVVRFDAPLAEPSRENASDEGKRRLKHAALLTGACLALLPANPRGGEPAQPPSDTPVQLRVPDGKRAPSPTAIVRIVLPPLRPARATPPSVVQPNAGEPVRKASSQNEGSAPVAAAAIPQLNVGPLDRPPVAVEIPDPTPTESTVALAPIETTATPPASSERPVDIAQISDSEVRSLQASPAPVAATSTLSERIAAMQVTPLPPTRLRDADRAALLAEAPTRMTLRIGSTAVGQIDFRMGDTRTIDVKLSGLLDLLAGHYDSAEFARLRGSAAADAYVSFDQLRALGLRVRYDPAYDEVRVDG